MKDAEDVELWILALKELRVNLVVEKRRTCVKKSSFNSFL
jgi:hypothetical protein